MGSILFLDFDGVTHPDGCRADDLFCQLPLIEGVLQRRPGVQVVISSSWRETRSLEVLRRYFRQDLRERVIDCTPRVRQDPCEPALRHVRETECRSWLQTHRLDVIREGNWLALDDMPQLFTRDCPNLLLTNPLTGFEGTDVARLESRLVMCN